jgi:hypothetical protein
MRKDKDLAIRYFEKLAIANPENQKLEEIKKEIEALEENL